MLQLYNVARGNMARLVPKEVRILRHLLSIDDAQERSAEMRNAFTPGLEFEGKDVDELYTYEYFHYSTLSRKLTSLYSVPCLNFCFKVVPSCAYDDAIVLTR